MCAKKWNYRVIFSALVDTTNLFQSHCANLYCQQQCLDGTVTPSLAACDNASLFHSIEKCVGLLIEWGDECMKGTLGRSNNPSKSIQLRLENECAVYIAWNVYNS